MAYSKALLGAAWLNSGAWLPYLCRLAGLVCSAQLPRTSAEHAANIPLENGPRLDLVPAFQLLQTRRRPISFIVMMPFFQMMNIAERFLHYYRTVLFC